MAFGTLQVKDTLQALRIADGTVADYGEERVWTAVNAALVAHNRITAEIVSDLADVSTARQTKFGGIDTMVMEELDEYGRSEAQKITAGALMGAPLRKYGAGLQWTRDYFMIAQTSEIAAQLTAMFTADVRAIQREVKRAFFLSTNFTYIDRLIDYASLAVKRLINADSSVMPLGPNGETFNGATHTHYNGATAAWSGATAAQRGADIQALITDVVEHINSGSVQIYINQASETYFTTTNMTGFIPYQYTNVRTADNVTIATGRNLDPVNIYDRAIGIFNGVEIFVKPWIPAGYILAFNSAAEEKPLWIRVRGSGKDGTQGPARGFNGTRAGNSVSPFGDLYLVADNENYPLRAKQYAREFGVAVQNRIAAAILDTANTTYANPTIT